MFQIEANNSDKDEDSWLKELFIVNNIQKKMDFAVSLTLNTYMFEV